MKKIYLVPTPISENIKSIPQESIDAISISRVFICERVRTSRRFIKSVLKDFDIDGSVFIELSKKQQISQNQEIINVLKEGRDCCFMSEAGSPCIADPGSTLVDLARRENYQIIPLSGPSSIIQSLMASGMNGQQFTFHGYLPVKNHQLINELKRISKTVKQTGYTQIFIETPYRNKAIFESILSTVDDNLRLNISYAISAPSEHINTMTVKLWKREKKIQGILKDKNPCIFIIGK